MTGQHLPFVIRWPAGMPGGQVIRDVFSWVDMVPTLCDAAGVSMPEEACIDGVSVLPALREEQEWPRELAYHEMGWSRSVIKGRYHYIATRYPESAIEEFKKDDPQIKPGIGQMFDNLNAPFIPDYFEPDQLYDLLTDPFERHNLVDDPTRADVLEDLKDELWKIAETMPRPFPREPHPFRQTERYKKLEAERRAEVDAIEHYPPNCDVPRVWYANLHDPGAPD
jgi:arylsulfatase A-like enzyme